MAGKTGRPAPPTASDPRPAILLRLELQRHRAAGRDFRDVWDVAVIAALAGVRYAEREAWEIALSGTRGSWERAYYRLRAHRREDAPYALAGLAS